MTTSANNTNTTLTVEQTIENVFADLIFFPFFLLPEAERQKRIRILQGVFGALSGELTSASAGESAIGIQTHAVLDILAAHQTDEHALALRIREIFQMVHEDIGDTKLGTTLRMIIDRSLTFAASEKRTSMQRSALSVEEIKQYDNNILRTNMQLYALDYFLTMHMHLKNQIKNATEIILHGTSDLPALRSDALEDDMLKKIVYELLDTPLRTRMILDYYAYKRAFIPIVESEQLTAGEIQTVQDALRIYCTSLLQVSIAHGIATIGNGIYMPFPTGTSLTDIARQL